MTAPEDPTGRGRAWVTVECEECGHVSEGWDRGVGSAAWKNGTHKYGKHKIGGRGPSAARKGEPTPDELAGDGTSPVTASIRSMASAAGGRKGKPSADDLAAALGRGAGLTIMAAAVHVVEADPAIPPGPEGDRVRDALIDRLSLSDRAAKEVMAPFGRIIAPTRFNDRYGRAVVDNADAVGSIAELANLAMAWRGYLRERRAAIGSAYTDPGPHPDLIVDPSWLEDDLEPAAVGPEGFVTTPAPQAGVILTPADVARLRGTL